MSTSYIVQIGNTQFDPVGEYLTAVEADRQSDPTVAERCSRLLRYTLNSMCEFDKLESHDEPGEMHFLTPEVACETASGTSGFIQLEAVTKTVSQPGANPSITDRTACLLRVREASETDSQTIMAVDSRSIRRRAIDGMRRAGHVELDYFGHMVSKLGAAAMRYRRGS